MVERDPTGNKNYRVNATVLPGLLITYNKGIPVVLDRQPKNDKECKRIEQAAT